MRIPVRLRDAMAVVAVGAAVLTACSGESATETTTTVAPGSTTTVPSDQQVVFGRGELPETVPADFPIPDQAVFGATLIDRPRGVTEVVATFPAAVPAVVEFFETNLPAVGYVLDSSSGTDAEWHVTFSRDDLTGEVVLTPGGSGLSQGAIVLRIPVSN